MGLLIWVHVRYRSWLQDFLILGPNLYFYFFPLKVLMMKATLKVTALPFSFHMHYISWQSWCLPECFALGSLGSDTTLMQGNGDIATSETQSSMVNGYTCSDCSMLSERKEVLTAYSPPHVPSSRIYSRDRSQKHASSKLLSLVSYLDSRMVYNSADAFSM